MTKSLHLFRICITILLSLLNVVTSQCATPSAIGATIVSSGPYLNGSVARYHCWKGFYLISQSSLVCDGSNWLGSRPVCSSMATQGITISNEYVFTSSPPDWLLILLGVVAGLAALLLLTCILVCCLRFCGCWNGNLFGIGSRVYPENGGGDGWVCCPRHTPARSFVGGAVRIIDLEGDTNNLYRGSDRPRKKQKTKVNRPGKIKAKNKKGIQTESGDIFIDDDETTQVIYVLDSSRNKSKKAKELSSWIPHSNPVRTNNTSTK